MYVHAPKQNVPGFEQASVEKTGTIPIYGDTHRILGEYVLTEADIYGGKAFEDSIAVSNMGPDIYGPDGEHVYELVLPHDIPCRCLVSKQTENLLGAGSTMSADFYAFAANRYCTPSICTGQAAGTAAALAVDQKVSPKQLDVALLQKTLRERGARVTVKDLSPDVLSEYRETFEAHTKIIEVQVRTSPIRWDPETGGGSLMDVGCYWVNGFCKVAGTEPAEVQAHDVARGRTQGSHGDTADVPSRG